jgi:hypothetical protein
MRESSFYRGRLDGYYGERLGFGMIHGETYPWLKDDDRYSRTTIAFWLLKYKFKAWRQSCGRISSMVMMIFSDKKCCDKMLIICEYLSSEYSFNAQFRCKHNFTYHKARTA